MLFYRGADLCKAAEHGVRGAVLYLSHQAGHIAAALYSSGTSRF